MRNNISKLIFLAILLTGCGGGGGSSAWNGPTNSEGFPDVAGRYAPRLSQTQVNCSNDSSATNDSISRNLIVEQSGNNLLFRNENGQPFIDGPNWRTVTPAEGLIQRDAHFQVSQRLESNEVTTRVTMEGQFFQGGLSGELRATGAFHDLGVTCTYFATFDGERL